MEGGSTRWALKGLTCRLAQAGKATRALAEEASKGRQAPRVLSKVVALGQQAAAARLCGSAVHLSPLSPHLHSQGIAFDRRGAGYAPALQAGLQAGRGAGRQALEGRGGGAAAQGRQHGAVRRVSAARLVLVQQLAARGPNKARSAASRKGTQKQGSQRHQGTPDQRSGGQ